MKYAWGSEYERCSSNDQSIPLFDYFPRNWYSQDQDIVECFQSDYRLAEECWERVLAEDLEGIGRCFSKYWTIKRSLAPGSEPQLVSNILHVLDPLVLGGGLAGAGGGGFLAALLRPEVSMETVREEIRKIPGTERLTFHQAAVDQKGLQVFIDDEEIQIDFE